MSKFQSSQVINAFRVKSSGLAKIIIRVMGLNLQTFSTFAQNKGLIFGCIYFRFISYFNNFDRKAS